MTEKLQKLSAKFWHSKFECHETKTENGFTVYVDRTPADKVHKISDLTDEFSWLSWTDCMRAASVLKARRGESHTPQSERYKAAQEISALKRKFRSMRYDSPLVRINRILERLNGRLNPWPHYTLACALAEKAREIREQTEEEVKQESEFLKEVYLRTGIYCRKNYSAMEELQKEIRHLDRLYTKVYNKYREAILNCNFDIEAECAIRLSKLAKRIMKLQSRIPAAVNTPEEISSHEYHVYAMMQGIATLENKDFTMENFQRSVTRLKFLRYHLRNALKKINEMED